jgi:hypothetical protein
MTTAHSLDAKSVLRGGGCDARLRITALLRRAIGPLGLSAILILNAGCQSQRSSFYPIGIYAVSRTNDLPIVRDAGFNLVVGTASEPYLEASSRLGLRVLASPGTSAGKDFSQSAAKETIAKFDNHPAVWAWYVSDEPDFNQVPPHEVVNAHRSVKRSNARKPTALVLYQGSSALHYANIADILMIDRYPIPWLPLANFPQHVRMARLALGPRKPLMAVIQVHDWSYYRDLLPDETNLRPPSYEELRAMTYCALAQRANGLFYYCFDDDRWKVTEHDGSWQALKQVIAEVKARLPLFEAEHLWWPNLQRFKNTATQYNAALESSVTPAFLRVANGNRTIPAGLYMLTVNNTDKKHDYSFYLPGAAITAIPVVAENRVVLTADGWINDQFEPYAIHVYGPLPATVKQRF